MVPKVTNAALSRVVDEYRHRRKISEEEEDKEDKENDTFACVRSTQSVMVSEIVL